MKADEMMYTKVRNVHDLTRGTDEAAGLDFYVPYYDQNFMHDLIAKNPNAHAMYNVYWPEGNDKSNQDAEGNTYPILEITLLPGARILIPSGIKTCIAPGTMLMAANKSGVSTKQGLVYTAEIVDSDYAGEVHLGIANFTDTPTTILTGQKLIQFIHTPIILSKPQLIDTETFENYHKNSLRGEKGFGSNIEKATK